MVENLCILKSIRPEVGTIWPTQALLPGRFTCSTGTWYVVASPYMCATARSRLIGACVCPGFRKTVVALRRARQDKARPHLR